MRIDYQKFFIACAKAQMTMTSAIATAGLSNFLLHRIKQGKNVNALTVGKLSIVLGVPVESLLELKRG